MAALRSDADFDPTHLSLMGRLSSGRIDEVGIRVLHSELAQIGLAAAGGDDSAYAALGGDAARSWAGRITDAADRSRVKALAACGYCSDCGSEYYGLLDPDDGDVITALLRLDEDDSLYTWRGSTWESVPDEYDPIGAPYAELDEQLVADLVAALSGGSSALVLRASSPRAWLPESLSAAAGPPPEAVDGVYAIVDDFDTTAVLELVMVAPGPKSYRREAGEWVLDPSVIASLKSVDPPAVVPIDPETAPSIVVQVDDYDAAHPKEGITAAIPWDESKFKRDATGKFSTKEEKKQRQRDRMKRNRFATKKATAKKGGRPALTPESIAKYVREGGKRPVGVKMSDEAKKRAEARKAKQESKTSPDKGTSESKPEPAAEPKPKPKPKPKPELKPAPKPEPGRGPRARRRNKLGGQEEPAPKTPTPKAPAVEGPIAPNTDKAPAAKAPTTKPAYDKPAAAKVDTAPAGSRLQAPGGADLKEAPAAPPTDDPLAQAEMAQRSKFDIEQAKVRKEEDRARAEFDADIKQRYELLIRRGLTQQEARAKVGKLVQKEATRRERWDIDFNDRGKSEKIRRMESDIASSFSQQRRRRRPGKPIAAAAVEKPATTRMPNDLENYWTRGKGAAKIRWGAGGDFNRCRRALAKYLRPDQVSGACANLHRIATGTWPGKNKKHKGPISASAYSGDGSMVAVFLPTDVAGQLAVYGGNDPSDLHVTLAYLGEADAVTVAKAAQVARSVASGFPSLEGEINGLGAFTAGDDGRHPVWASVDVPGLSEFRSALVDALEASGVPVSKDHGFAPHVTLTYSSDPESDLESMDLGLPVPVAFDTVTTCYKAKQSIHSPLAGPKY